MEPKTVNKDKKLNSRNGFIGVLPEKWQVNPLDQVAEVKQGVSKGRNFKEKKILEVPYLRVANVLDGEFNLNEIKTIEVLESEFALYNLKTNDILITEGGDPDKLGRGSIWKDQIQGVVYQNHLFRIRCIGKSLSAEFLAQYIQGRAAKNYFLSCAKQTTGIASINLSQIRTTPIPVPPLPEQNKIAAVLSAWDEAIQTARQLLEARQLRKSALMQQLLTGETRLPGFIEAWQDVKLNQVFRRLMRRNDQGNTNVLTISAKYGLISQTEYFNKVVASEEVRNYYLLNRGEFAYNKSSSAGYDFGAIKRLDLYERGILSPLYICLEITEGDSDFYTHFFEAGQLNHGIYKIAQEGARNHGLLNISVIDFFQITFKTPSLSEQRAIATVLNAADEEIRLSTAEIEVLKEQKSGLMQQLLTGKMRVRIEEKETA
ncbi:restriction endonuclease subunit S [Telluribacter humicola]|uniref:restriction endonuclease subunit S n=1 Tax=Telluribacter humicola TaxID=1720261 RepID=UPI001A966274|nr:restriction endonuclease subunit S [Telluribacter humicola]